MTTFADRSPSTTPVGLAVVLPGRGYTVDMPLLAFAGNAALEAGWVVRAVAWEAPELGLGETVTWVGQQLAAAVDDHAGPVLVIGKSLGSCAAPYAAEHAYDAVWLTPLIAERAVADGIRANPGRQLVIGGTADPFWDSEAAAALGDAASVVEIDGADHGMTVDGDAIRTAEIHLEVTRVVLEFLCDTDEAA